MPTRTPPEMDLDGFIDQSKKTISLIHSTIKALDTVPISYWQLQRSFKKIATELEDSLENLHLIKKRKDLLSVAVIARSLSKSVERNLFLIKGHDLDDGSDFSALIKKVGDSLGQLGDGASQFGKKIQDLELNVKKVISFLKGLRIQKSIKIGRNTADILITIDLKYDLELESILNNNLLPDVFKGKISLRDELIKWGSYFPESQQRAYRILVAALKELEMIFNKYSFNRNRFKVTIRIFPEELAALYRSKNATAFVMPSQKRFNQEYVSFWPDESSVVFFVSTKGLEHSGRARSTFIHEISHVLDPSIKKQFHLTLQKIRDEGFATIMEALHNGFVQSLEGISAMLAASDKVNLKDISDSERTGKKPNEYNVGFFVFLTLLLYHLRKRKKEYKSIPEVMYKYTYWSRPDTPAGDFFYCINRNKELESYCKVILGVYMKLSPQKFYRKYLEVAKKMHLLILPEKDLREFITS
ncbi:hypothetical protein J4210_00910 [Candidatus Woesearchaeota archaeon]|nr:hypothetical protein [Candidatus Woesearchaeota archaeon]